MKLETHVKILTFLLRLKGQPIEVRLYSEDDTTPWERIDELDCNPLGLYYPEEKMICLRDFEGSVSVLAHEMRHAYQFKNIHKRKYAKGLSNYKQPGEGFWKYRQARFQKVEREAYAWGLWYSIFTLEFDSIKWSLKRDMHDYFYYYFGMYWVLWATRATVIAAAHTFKFVRNVSVHLFNWARNVTRLAIDTFGPK